jgi:hypothetical protein
MLTSALFANLAGCAFNEELPEGDVTGKVILPREAATRDTLSLEDADGDGFPDTTADNTDVRLIGSVFLGAFSGIDTTSFAYPHPSMGPVIDPHHPGDTFPYGGTSVGRYDYACYEAVACQVVTGRFAGWDKLLSYFNDLLGVEVVDMEGEVVDNPSTYQQRCYHFYKVTSDAELPFISTAEDLDFKENADGDFEAEFTMPHTYLVDGMVIWGFMDAPELSVENTSINGQFTSCTTSTDQPQAEYDNTYERGRSEIHLLNLPSEYITPGDWVANGEATVSLDADGVAHLDQDVVLDVKYE